MTSARVGILFAEMSVKLTRLAVSVIGSSGDRAGNWVWHSDPDCRPTVG